MNQTAFVVVSSLLGLAILCILVIAGRFLPKYFRSLMFRWYFHYFPEPEEEKELRKLQLKTCIIPELKNLAKVLNDIYNKENQNLNIINRIDHGTVNDFEGMRGNVIEIRKEIKRSERDFYRARYTAEYFGFVVPKDFKEYL
jgi:hypothetical protein